VVIDTLFLCVCEDKNINGEMWHKSPIIKLSKSKKPIVKNSTNPQTVKTNTWGCFNFNVVSNFS